ncbi:MAG: transglycosylase SLT domain-containing protein [Candidatus Nanopelagicales bacterium]
MKKHGLRMLVATTAVAIPLTAAGLAPASAAPASAAPTSAVAAVKAPAKRVSPRAAAIVPASVATGPSKWRGAPLRHPRGGHFYAKVRRWANLVSAVMVEHRIKQKYLPGILAQIQQESGGNPKAANLWDSNAKAGHPSRGLLQVIAPTYRSYAKPGYRNLRYQTVPYTNIWSALNYVKHAYGMGKFKKWYRGANQAY